MIKKRRALLDLKRTKKIEKAIYLISCIKDRLKRDTTDHGLCYYFRGEEKVFELVKEKYREVILGPNSKDYIWVPKEDQYWWPRRDRQIRIDFLDKVIAELEAEIQNI